MMHFDTLHARRPVLIDAQVHSRDVKSSQVDFPKSHPYVRELPIRLALQNCRKV